MNNERKPTRLKNYDYSENGAYFVTVCVKDKKCILSKISVDNPESVGEGLCALPKTELTKIGKEVEKSLLYIDSTYDYVRIEKYVVMPNHIHMIIIIDNNTGGRGDPPLQDIIRNFKSYTTKQYGSVLWQRSYYDHIIRGEEDYLYHVQYIEENPKKWLIGKDEYYA